MLMQNTNIVIRGVKGRYSHPVLTTNIVIRGVKGRYSHPVLTLFYIVLQKLEKPLEHYRIKVIRDKIGLCLSWLDSRIRL